MNQQKIELDYGRRNPARVMGTIVVIVVAACLFELATLWLAFGSIGGGGGGYGLALILFPYAFLAAAVDAEQKLNGFSLLLAAVQFPLYAIPVTFAVCSKRRGAMIALAVVLAVHVIITVAIPASGALRTYF